MNRSLSSIARTATVAGLLLAILSPPAATRAAETEDALSLEETVTRVYRVSHLDLRDAALLAHQLCLNAYDSEHCGYSIEGQNWFSYRTHPEMHDQITALLKSNDRLPASLNMRVVLLVADNNQRPEPDLPDAEARALDDLKQFLPYKGYRVLESGWVRTKARGELRLGTDPLYLAEIDLRGDRSPGDRSVHVRGFRLATEIPTTVITDSGKAQESFRSMEILSTSFTMDVGETVVVGTSKLNGDDEALVVLLTSQP
jgi:hypothetical protein